MYDPSGFRYVELSAVRSPTISVDLPATNPDGVAPDPEDESAADVDEPAGAVVEEDESVGAVAEEEVDVPAVVRDGEGASAAAVEVSADPGAVGEDVDVDAVAAEAGATPTIDASNAAATTTTTITDARRVAGLPQILTAAPYVKKCTQSTTTCRLESRGPLCLRTQRGLHLPSFGRGHRFLQRPSLWRSPLVVVGRR